MRQPTTGGRGRRLTHTVTMYSTRGCGDVTPAEYRTLLALREQREGRRFTGKRIPWDLQVTGTFTIEVAHIEDGCPECEEELAG